MSRYIDAEWLEENAKQYSLGYYDYDEWATPLNVLDSAPSIDIVRCKECKHWHSNTEFCNKFSHKGFIAQRMLADGFCSYGEREGE